MKSTRALMAFCLLPAVLGGCQAGPGHAPTARTKVQAEMRTIDDIDPRPAVLDPPPVLREEAAPPRPKGQPWEKPQPVVLTAEDERVRASLPFAPAIALDPIDGTKISILARTPTCEYKGRVFYFSSEENKRTFLASPDQYIKNAFSRL